MKIIAIDNTILNADHVVRGFVEDKSIWNSTGEVLEKESFVIGFLLSTGKLLYYSKAFPSEEKAMDVLHEILYAA